MNDLHLPGGAHPMDVDHASLDKEEALAGLSFVEKIFAFVQISYAGKRTDLSDLGGGSPAKIRERSNEFAMTR